MVMVSIVVPIYNVEKYLHECVDSILTQTFTDFELILVNDGSQDNSGAICDEYVSKDKRIKVIHQVNQGVSVARNNGIKCATGRLIGFVDADDYIAPDMFKGMVNYLEANDLDVVCADCYIINRYYYRNFWHL